MTLKCIMPSKSQTHKAMYCMFPFIELSEQDKIMGTENIPVVSKGRKWGRKTLTTKGQYEILFFFGRIGLFYMY